MIRIGIKSSRYESISSQFNELFAQEDINIESLNLLKYYDIYVIEVNDIVELELLKKINKQSETLIYIIGPKDFDIANMCLRMNVNLYILNSHLNEEINKYKSDIMNHVQERFQFYEYKRNGIYSQIRLSQIFYIESLRHSIIIHASSGEFVERKNLSEFIKEVSSNRFIQIHKSFVVNIQHIERITNKDIIIKDGSVLPVGRVYKARLNEI